MFWVGVAMVLVTGALSLWVIYGAERLSIRLRGIERELASIRYLLELREGFVDEFGEERQH